MKPKIQNLNKTYYVYDETHECHALYNESRVKIIQWQDGDEVYKVLRRLLEHYNISMFSDFVKYQEGTGFPEKI